MKLTRRKFVATVPAALAAVNVAAKPSSLFAEEQYPWRLWYRQSAERWLDSLPLGNGRLGAMIFGGIRQEILALNESTVWSGSPNASNVSPTARMYLGAARQLLFEGKYAEANALCDRHLSGSEGSYGTHLPLAKLKINQGGFTAADATAYQRSLDLRNALANVEFTVAGVRFAREAFISNPDQILVVRFTADRPGQQSLTITLDSGDLPGERITTEKNQLVLTGCSWEKKHSDGTVGVIFQTTVQAMADGGSVARNNSSLEVKNANNVTLLIAANTSYKDADYSGLCESQMQAAMSVGYENLRARHIADHRRFFERVKIDLGGEKEAQKPTDARLSALRAGASDPNLYALFFQYGRYLLIAGSRENSPLAMNLQGIWNDNLAANMAWTCDFHLDINTQQNYWPSEVCNLSECAEPLFKLVEALSHDGQATAKNMYGARGWVCHVYTNAWGFTAPGVGLGWGPFVTGGAWTASHLWEHYLFSRDRAFLEKRAYPVLKRAAEFFLDYMVEDPKHHWLVTGPSVSPENVFLSPDGQRCSVSMGPTCDRELVYGLFCSCIEAASILNIDAEFRNTLLAAKGKLPPIQIGKHDQIQEWLEDFEEAEPNHRHTSHLLALFPLGQITPEKTPDLAKAARVTIERRAKQKNWEDVEWTRTNMMHFFARLADGEAAREQLLSLLNRDTDRNLMTFSRAGVAGAEENIFAIDGNTGASSGIAEMLLQSHADIHLLPALPKEWADGSISGLRARGGFEVDIRWKAGTLKSAVIHSDRAGKHTVRYGRRFQEFEFKAGQALHLDEGLQVVGS